MTGRLVGVGVGPGDPELLTLKAVAAIREADVVAYPRTAGGAFARTIAERHLVPGVAELPLDTPMSRDPEPARAAYDAHAAAIAAHLELGRDVAFLCEGDSLFYGTFAYVMERLSLHHPVSIIPGVPALTAATAAAETALAVGDTVLCVVPAVVAREELRRRMAGNEALALMKIGRNLAEVRDALSDSGRLEDAVLVERASLPAARCRALSAVSEDAAPYFSMVLVPKRNPPVPGGRGVPAIVVLGASGLETARRLAACLGEAEIHGLAGRIETADRWFGDAVCWLRELFRAGRPVIGVCAAGILIRALAPLLSDKKSEPPVIAVAADGSAVVPLLGGHAGANAMAARLASALGVRAAVTTAGDVSLGFALDDPPPGWHVANREAAKGVAASLLAGERVGIAVEAGDAGWLLAHDGFLSGEKPSVIVTDRAAARDTDALILHPPVLAVGVGCDRGADPEKAIAHVRRCLAGAGLAEGAVVGVFSVDVKMDEPAVHAVAAALGVSVRFFSPAELEALTPRLRNPSETVFRVLGCHGVSEAAALAAAGPAARLVVEKTADGSVTCAMARADGNIDIETIGRPRGRLFVVGVGPGAAEWRTPEVTHALALASDVVGYRPYLDLVADLIGAKTRHSSAMTQEESRVRMALDLAASGRTVALVSSGDPGIYALAALVFELLEGGDRADWRRIQTTVCPGVSAMQAAAARLGAPLGHDFTAISLSDLLTPWDAIERRLSAAADGDFVVALYNPVSKRRRGQLARARDILLGGRPADTPVIVARDLGRPEERTRIVALGDLQPDDADMHTVLIVGSSTTRRFGAAGEERVYTPRGYAGKRRGG